MLTELLIEAAAREGRAILDAVEKAPHADVDCCPGWDTTRLLGHVGGVHRFVTRIVANRAKGPLPGEPTDKPPTGAEPWEWYREGLDTLLEALRGIDATEPVWSWTDRRDGGFYQRRMAHENTIHRYDAETATGTPAHIDPQMATDGVAEILAVAMRYRGNGATIEYPDSSMLLVRTDGADRWLVRAMDGTLLIAHNGDAGHRADTTLTGPAEDLYLHLWGRPAPALSVTGDGDAAAAWSAVAP
jgi:uncharacterized protein (TIGR03083 family)